jgi:MFS family permease
MTLAHSETRKHPRPSFPVERGISFAADTRFLTLFGILFYSASWALGTEIVPQDQAGRYLGISNLAGAGAGAIGAYIGGPIADHVGYVLLFAIYGGLFLLSVLALKGVREKGLPPVGAS